MERKVMCVKRVENGKLGFRKDWKSSDKAEETEMGWHYVEQKDETEVFKDM